MMYQPPSSRVVTGAQSLELIGFNMSRGFEFDGDESVQRVFGELESYASDAGASIFEQMMREFDEGSGLLS